MADDDSRDGTTYATASILGWLAELHAPHDEALEGAFTASARTSLPAIHVGPLEGKFLGLLVRLIGAQKVVEIGTLAGYSALWMARALPEGGTLYTVDHSEEACRVARATCDAGGVGARVKIVHSDGLKGLASIENQGPFDMVFVDADKGRYDQYAKWALRNLRRGGIIVGDNALFFGNLLDQGNDSAQSMRDFHRELTAGFDSTCIPTPDGMAIGIRR